MAKGRILGNFIKAFTSGSGIQSERELTKAELAELRALKSADETEKIEWTLSSRIKASVDEKEARREAKARQKSNPSIERARG